jgi:hypothetical protein
MSEPLKSHIRELVEEYKTIYRSLTPEQRWEADVKRAYKIITYFMETKNLSPQSEDAHREWLLANFEKEYVQEAILRYFDTPVGVI